jgi:hypothetical protein
MKNLNDSTAEKKNKMFKNVPYPRFWSFNRDTSNKKNNKNSQPFLKKIKTSTNSQMVKLKNQIFCPIYTCYYMSESKDKMNQHLKESHRKVFESGFEIKKNGRLEYKGDLEKLKVKALSFIKTQSEYVDKAIFPKGNEKSEEIKKLYEGVKNQFTDMNKL